MAETGERENGGKRGQGNSLITGPGDKRFVIITHKQSLVTNWGINKTIIKNNREESYRKELKRGVKSKLGQ